MDLFWKVRITLFEIVSILSSSIFELLSVNRLLLLMKNVISSKKKNKTGSSLRRSTYHPLRNRFEILHFQIAFH